MQLQLQVMKILQKLREMQNCKKCNGNIAVNCHRMVHHTRNTDSKQWAETVVLAISGITRVFKIYFSTILQLPEFSNYWKKILDEIYVCSIHRSAEISTVK